MRGTKVSFIFLSALTGQAAGAFDLGCYRQSSFTGVFAVAQVRPLNEDASREVEKFLNARGIDDYRLCLKGYISRRGRLDVWWAEIVPVERTRDGRPE